MTPDEGPLQVRRGLAAQRALHHPFQAPPQFARLRDARAAVEQLVEGRLVAQQRAAAVDVLHQRPQLVQRVLHGRGGQQQHRRGTDDLPHPVRGAGMGAVLVVDAVAVVAPVDAGEHLVRFVDQAQVERRRLAQPLAAPLAARVLAPGDEHARRGHVHAAVRRVPDLHPEQLAQLALPLAEQGPRHHDQHAAPAFRKQLGDDETGLDGLAQPHLVREDAAPLGNAAERERHGLDLVRVRIHPSAPLRRHVAALLARPAPPDELLGMVAAMDGVQRNVERPLRRWAKRIRRKPRAPAPNAPAAGRAVTRRDGP